MYQARQRLVQSDCIVGIVSDETTQETGARRRGRIGTSLHAFRETIAACLVGKPVQGGCFRQVEGGK